jgi:hypothetical protein
MKQWNLREMKGTVALIYDKDHKLLFDKIIEVCCSKLLGLVIVPHQENLHIHIRSYKELHKQLGHPNDAVLKATATKFNLKYDTTPMPCENCACAKIKIKIFPKEPPMFMAKEKGDRIMFDISSVNALSQEPGRKSILVISHG